MSHPQFDVDKAFDSQPMNADQLADSAEVRAAAKILAHMILAHVPGSPQRSVALRKLQDVTVWSNKALAENPPEVKAAAKILAHMTLAHVPASP